MKNNFVYNDGGRANAGYSGVAGDCVVRAISIATEMSYEKTYRDIFSFSKSTPRNGVKKNIVRKYMESIGWKWVPCMGIGTGCKVHLKKDELPNGRLVVSLSKHVVAVIDGVVHDTTNPSRDGTRCVYGYYIKL